MPCFEVGNAGPCDQGRATVGPVQCATGPVPARRARWPVGGVAGGRVAGWPRRALDRARRRLYGTGQNRCRSKQVTGACQNLNYVR